MKELSVELRDRIVSRHRSGKEYQKMSAALKVPKNTVASIILKWKKFGTTKTLPRAAKLSNRRRRSLVEPSRRTTISAALHQSGLYGRVSRLKPLLSKRHTTARLEFSKRHLKDSQTMRNKIIWSDEPKIELFCLNAQHHVWRKPGTIPTVKYGGGSVMLSGCFSVAGTGRQDRGKDERSKVQTTCSRALRTSDWSHQIKQM